MPTSPASDLSPPRQGAPLAGVRVLDLTRLLPGPMGTLHLADLGADVIKIEDTGAGDYTAAPVRRLVNRNKRGIRLDLKQPEGVEALLRLCEDADVLVESFRPGVMERLGVGYAAAAARNPCLVYCSLSGYGQTGPGRDAPGHDLNYSGYAGVADQMGADADTPALSNVPVADLLGGSLTAVMGILAALFDAARSGRGRHVDIAMADGLLAHAVIPLATLNASGRTRPAGADKLTGALPCYAQYRTADGRFVAMAALERKFWDRFCEHVARPDWQPRHLPRDEAEAAALRAELAALFASRPLAHWADLFAADDCCVTPVLRLDETLAHPRFEARGMVLPLDERGARQTACPVRMSGFEFAVHRPAPQPGEHTDEVLAASGYGPAALAALRARGAIG